MQNSFLVLFQVWFEFLPFGLTNPPLIFYRLVNSIFYNIIDKYTLVYLGSILVNSEGAFQNEEQFRSVL